LDISYISENYDNSDEWKSVEFTRDQQIHNLVEEISKNFGTWGFLYIKGHGIEKELINNAFTESKDFFTLPEEQKRKYNRGCNIDVGYVPPSGEEFDNMKPLDIKEAFDYVPQTELCKQLSNEIKTTNLTKLFKECNKLIFKFLRLLALALDIDIEYFIKLHHGVGDRTTNGTSMRMLYYPCIPSKVEENQQRCSEHTDYGTITLLFQDAIGGLEVLSPTGNFVKATPLDDTIVINAGDLLHTWSNGKFPATVHRVTIPTDISKVSKARQSIAFFTHPDYSVDIEFIDENGNKNKRNAYDHLKKRFNNTIKVDNCLRN